jgi:hypothetical protein
MGRLQLLLGFENTEIIITFVFTYFCVLVAFLSCQYVRWSLDVLEEPYEEVESVGILGVFLFGRLIPVLHVAKYKTVIANSRDIVRYLYSKHMLEDRAAFLKPIGGQAVDLEQRFEKLGGFARQWMLYYNFVVAGDQGRDLTLRTWGLHQQRVQAWQRLALRALYPVLKTAVSRLLKVDEVAYRRAVLEIEKTFDVVDELLADGRKYLLNTPEKTYLDMYLACMAAPALRPPEYSGGRIEPASKIRLDELSPAARKELERWRMRPTGKFVLRLFAEERGLSKCLL